LPKARQAIIDAGGLIPYTENFAFAEKGKMIPDFNCS
jgi:hypothetical protein